MKNYIALILTVFTLLSSCQTRTKNTTLPLAEGKAGSVGVSEQRLARIDVMCTKALEENQVSGMVALVARNGVIEKEINVSFTFKESMIISADTTRATALTTWKN